MEILFFYLNNKIAGVALKHLEEVVLNGKTVPFLNVSQVLDDVLIHKSKPIGLINLNKLFSLRQSPGPNSEVLLLNYNGMQFGLKVKKVLQPVKIPKSRIVKPEKELFIPSEFVHFTCRIGNKVYPLISLKKIIQNKEIKSFWYREDKQENYV